MEHAFDWEAVKFLAWALGSVIVSAITLASVYLRLVLHNAVMGATAAIEKTVENKYLTKELADARYHALEDRLRILETN